MSTTSSLTALDLKEQSANNNKLKAKLIQNNFIVPALGEKFYDIQIENAKTMLQILQNEQEAIKPTYIEKKKFYEEVKADFEEIESRYSGFNDRMQEQRQIIESIENFKTNPIALKMIRQGTPADHGAPKAHRTTINWIDEVSALLETKNQFLYLDEVFDILQKDERLIKLGESTKTGFKGLVYQAKRTIHDSAENDYSDNKYGRKKLLCYYKKRLGLYTWLNEEGVPKDPQHMKQFMFKDESPAAFHNKGAGKNGRSKHTAPVIEPEEAE